MATYRELHGKSVKTVTTNPTDTAAEGQIWFNSTENTFKSAVVGQAWSSGGPLSTGRYLSGSLGTQTAGVQIAGSNPPKLTNVEHYDGTGWSEGAAYPAAGSSMSGAGTQTAGIAYGGNIPSITSNAYDYNGTAWTAANSLPYAANNIASCGLAENSVIGAVGRDASSGNAGTNKSVTFDGTDFANGPTINTTRMFNNSSGAGTGTAALIVGGFIDPSPNAMTNCEEYNGSAWTATGVLNVATGFASAFGIQTNAVAQTNGSNYVETEGYDGSTWTTLPNMSVSSPGGLYGSSAGSTGDAGWVSSMGPAYSATEEFNKSVNIVTAGAWASGGDMPASYYGFSAFAGTQTAGIALGGKTPPGDQATILKYDGTSWSANPSNLNTARRSGASVGTQTATLLSGGVTGGSTFKNEVEEFDGSSASAQNTLPYSGSSNFGFGTQTAAVVAGGYAPPFPTLASTNAEYNGTNWTAGNPLPAGRGLGGSAGMAQTTGLIWAGLAPGAVDTTLEYDGTNWTAGGTYGESKSNIQGWGDQTSAIGAGGETSGDSTKTFIYDGTTWATQPSLPGVRKQSGCAGADATAGLIFGGETPPITNTTIEWTGETTSLNIQTLTQS